MAEKSTEAKYGHLCKGLLPLSKGVKVTSLAQKIPKQNKISLIKNKKPTVKNRKKTLLGIEFSSYF